MTGPTQLIAEQAQLPLLELAECRPQALAQVALAAPQGQRAWPPPSLVPQVVVGSSLRPATRPRLIKQPPRAPATRLMPIKRVPAGKLVPLILTTKPKLRRPLSLVVVTKPLTQRLLSRQLRLITSLITPLVRLIASVPWQLKRLTPVGVRLLSSQLRPASLAQTPTFLVITFAILAARPALVVSGAPVVTPDLSSDQTLRPRAKAAKTTLIARLVTSILAPHQSIKKPQLRAKIRNLKPHLTPQIEPQLAYLALKKPSVKTAQSLLPQVMVIRVSVIPPKEQTTEYRRTAPRGLIAAKVIAIILAKTAPILARAQQLFGRGSNLPGAAGAVPLGRPKTSRAVGSEGCTQPPSHSLARGLGAAQVPFGQTKLQRERTGQKAFATTTDTQRTHKPPVPTPVGQLTGIRAASALTATAPMPVSQRAEKRTRTSLDFIPRKYRR